MREIRRHELLGMLVLFCGAALLAAPARAAFIQSIPQICQEGNNCETGTTVSSPGLQSDMSRAWHPGPGFDYAASGAITTDFAAWSAFARGSGLENPETTGTTFTNMVSRGGRVFGNFNDTITAGSGGGAGFLRLPLHLVGNVSISWQNGFGTASFGVSCQSSEPGVPVSLGVCNGASGSFTASAAIDQVVNLDIPILLGSPVTYTASLVVAAATGHQYGDLIPFTGQAEISVATLPFEGAIVLDASRQPIPGATVSVAESGFDYHAVPEASAWLGAFAAVAALAGLRRR